ncbi:MAG: hypothetical protein H6828_06425 [Planctomycetes bacterium]|nr:hypothetical protein [Planctomycetota bacterium]
MKNLILGIALLGFAVACKSDDHNQVSDAATVEAPAGGCNGCSADMCDDAAKAECAGKSDCGSSCQGQAAKKVCPVTGKVIEN